MPVIRGEAVAHAIAPEQRKSVAEQLGRELAGKTTANGPVIFEIPFQSPDWFDVLVVWDAWKPFSSEERSNMILDAYGDRKTRIVQALGVTAQEAIEDQVLPYAVRAMTRGGEVDEENLKEALIAEGGMTLANGKVDLRLPTMAMAQAALRTLVDKLPNGHWALVQSVDSFP